MESRESRIVVDKEEEEVKRSPDWICFSEMALGGLAQSLSISQSASCGDQEGVSRGGDSRERRTSLD